MYFILNTKRKNNGRESLFNNDDVDFLFRDKFEVMENLVRLFLRVASIWCNGRYC